MVTDVLMRLGGVATRAQLLRLVGRQEFDAAVRSGVLVRVSRGRYALAVVGAGVATAHALSGVLCLTSAALHHGWEVKLPPELPQVSVPRHRKVAPEQRRVADVHWHDLGPDDVVDGIVTSKETTLLQCLRSLPFDEALAIADSAARAGEWVLLRRVARIARGRGAARVRAVVAAARDEAANPFESVLRAIALEVEGLRVEPQRLLETRVGWVRPDLVDVDLRIVLEADSFEWHGDRGALARDARRYNVLVIEGWLVLRFTWEEVMFRPEQVRETLVALVELVNGLAKVGCGRCPAA